LHSLDSSKFSWSSYWYPVHVLDHIDSSRPHAIELLGKQLVLWKDGSGRWNCFDDACPHRCLPATNQPAPAASTGSSDGLPQMHTRLCWLAASAASKPCLKVAAWALARLMLACIARTCCTCF
jgi:hypothetical protein